MIADIAFIEKYSKLEDADEDEKSTLKVIATAAESYIVNSTNHKFKDLKDEDKELFNLAVALLTSHWHENRALVGKITNEIELSLKSILIQLAFAYD